jgi:signal transduction histidine kinase
MHQVRIYAIISLLLIQSLTGCRYALPDDALVNPVSDRGYYNLGITNRPAALRIPIPPSSGMQYLVIENPHINTLQVIYKYRTDSLLTGDYFPFDQRPVPHRLFVVPVQASRTADTARLLISKSGENLSFRIRLLDVNQWQSFRDWDNSLSGIVMGFYVFLFLFTVFIVLIVRSRKSLILSCFILLTSAWMVNDAGIFFQHLWPDDPEFHNRSRGMFSSLNMFAFGLYVYQDIHRSMARGLTWVTRVLIGYLILKFLFLLMIRVMELPESFKQFTLLGNAIAFAVIFGWYIVNILYRLREYRDTVFEALAILLISLYSFLLSLKELGLAPAPIPWMNGYDVFLFHALQSLFIGLQFFVLERNKQAQNAQEMLDFQVEQERRLGERLLQAEESEKRRIARDIHDEIGSIFVSMKYMVLSLKETITDTSLRTGIESIQSLSDMGIRKQYAIIDDLLLKTEEGRSLESLLREKTGLISESTILNVSLRFEADETRMSEFQKMQILRILSELQTNALKHAEAEHIYIRIWTDDAIRIEFSDDGVGLVETDNSKGMGLQNIRHRLEFMRGSMEISSDAPGTRFSIRIPFEHE